MVNVDIPSSGCGVNMMKRARLSSKAGYINSIQFILSLSTAAPHTETIPLNLHVRVSTCRTRFYQGYRYERSLHGHVSV